MALPAAELRCGNGRRHEGMRRSLRTAAGAQQHRQGQVPHRLQFSIIQGEAMRYGTVMNTASTCRILPCGVILNSSSR